MMLDNRLIGNNGIPSRIPTVFAIKTFFTMSVFAFIFAVASLDQSVKNTKLITNMSIERNKHQVINIKEEEKIAPSINWKSKILENIHTRNATARGKIMILRAEILKLQKEIEIYPQKDLE